MSLLRKFTAYLLSQDRLAEITDEEYPPLTAAMLIRALPPDSQFLDLPHKLQKCLERELDDMIWPGRQPPKSNWIDMEEEDV